VRSYPKSRNPIRASSSSISTSTHIPPQVDSVSPTNRRWEGHRKHAHKRPLGNIKLDKETLSDYRVKRSRKWPRQQRAIEWITEAGKDHFDHHFATIMARWGVKPSYKSTCVLAPAAWAELLNFVLVSRKPPKLMLI